MAPPDRTNYGWSAVAVLIAILIGLALGRTKLTPGRCAVLNRFGINLSECVPDLKPGAMAGAKGPEFCKQVTVSTDAFISVLNVGLVDAGPSSTEVVVYPNIGAAMTTILATPAIPAGGSYQTQLSTVPVATTDFTIRVTADMQSVIQEGDETNNMLYGTCSR